MNEPRQLKALLGAFLRMELRNQAYAAATGAKPAEALPPLFWVLGQFLATSLLASLTLFLRVPAGFFATASLGVTTVLLGAALVVEFHEVAFQPDDALVLGHRPVSLATYARARLLNLLAAVALFAVATAIFPAALGAALLDSGPHFAWAFVLANLAVALGVAALVVGAFGLFGARWMTALRSALAWVQIGAILFVFYGAQLLLRRADGSLEVFALEPPTWLALTPWGALGDAVGAAAAGALTEAAVRLAVGLGVAAGLLAASTVLLQRAWAGLRAGERPAPVATPAEGGGGALGAGLARALTATPAEAAGFWLARTLLARDGDARLRALPALGLPASALALGVLTQQLADPWTARGSGVVLSLTVPVLLAGAVPALVSSLAVGRDEGAAALFQLAPLPSLEPVAFGATKAALLRFAGPLLLVHAVVVGVVWRAPLHAALEAALTLVLVLHAAAVAQPALAARVPFSAHAVGGGAVGPVALWGAACTAFGMGVAAVRYALGPALAPQLTLLGVLAVALVPSVRAARRRTAAALARPAGGAA